MIKRRTKRQQQKGRKEPKAKRKLNKRMLKKKTTLKMEIPKLMRYFSSTKAGCWARCAGSTAAGALLGSRGWGVTATQWGQCSCGTCPGQLPGRACRNGLLLPAPSCPVLEPFHRCCLLALVPWGWLTAMARIWGTVEPRDITTLQPWADFAHPLWTAGFLCCSARVGAGPENWFWVLHNSLKQFFGSEQFNKRFAE